jgi:hypothetical protein
MSVFHMLIRPGLVVRNATLGVNIGAESHDPRGGDDR